MPAYFLEVFVVLLGLVLLITEAFVPSKSKAWLAYIGAAALTVILIALFFARGFDPALSDSKWAIWNLYQFDEIALFFKCFALVATIFTLVLAADYRGVLKKYTDQPQSEEGTGEFYSLLIFACAGMMWMASSKHLACAFVALELVTITFYILVAYMRRSIGSLEAGVKYLILGALSTGFLVYGIAWVYGSLGTLDLGIIEALFNDGRGELIEKIPLLFGVALMLIALMFKIGVVPIHVWVPDVYQGAPTPTTAFLSIASKAAGFGLLIRFLSPFIQPESPVRNQIFFILGILSIATLLFGAFAAIPQKNFKRILAYSSISQAGFMLLPLGMMQVLPPEIMVYTVLFYLSVYLMMTFGAFFVLSLVSQARGGEEVAHFKGLAKTNPGLAFALTIFLAAMAGVPLTAGFIGKFMIFQYLVTAQAWLLLAVTSIAAIVGFYYYFKVLVAVWWQEPDHDAKPVRIPLLSRFAIVGLSVLILLFGFYPMPIQQALISILHHGKVITK